MPASAVTLPLASLCLKKHKVLRGSGLRLREVLTINLHDSHIENCEMERFAVQDSPCNGDTASPKKGFVVSESYFRVVR